MYSLFFCRTNRSKNFVRILRGEARGARGGEAGQARGVRAGASGRGPRGARARGHSLVRGEELHDAPVGRLGEHLGHEVGGHLLRLRRQDAERELAELCAGVQTGGRARR